MERKPTVLRSIEIKKTAAPGWVSFTPPQGGFRLIMPRQPYGNRNIVNADGSPLEYEANDEPLATASWSGRRRCRTIVSWKKIRPTWLDGRSFQLSDRIDKPLTRRTGLQGLSLPGCLLPAKRRSYIRIRCLIRGPHYYLLAVAAGQRPVLAIFRFL